MRLLTFVHVSDLHFGDIDPGTFDAAAPSLWANFRWFDGLLGHRHRALEALEAFFLGMRGAEEAQLIVTGDVTTFGRQAQFDMASRYLERFLVPPDGNYCGLGAADWKDRSIPGNHDHWPGRARFWGAAGPGLNSTFPARPFVGTSIALPNRSWLRFIGIDTDADVWPFGRQRALAHGSFASQLTEAERALPARSDPDEVRVLLLHHSRACTGKTLRMETASRAALDVFLYEQDIAVMLCGHTHVPYVQPFALTRAGRTIEVLEARAGTTTQRDTIPHSWRCTAPGFLDREPD